MPCMHMQCFHKSKRLASNCSQIEVTFTNNSNNDSRNAYFPSNWWCVCVCMVHYEHGNLPFEQIEPNMKWIGRIMGLAEREREREFSVHGRQLVNTLEMWAKNEQKKFSLSVSSFITIINIGGFRSRNRVIAFWKWSMLSKLSFYTPHWNGVFNYISVVFVFIFVFVFVLAA